MEDSVKTTSSNPLVDNEVTLDDFEKAFGEKVSSALNLDSWPLGENLADIYSKLEQEVQQAVKDEENVCGIIRNTVFPEIAKRQTVPNAGLHCFNESHIDKGLKGFLFNGSVDACDGSSVVHDTLALTITQIIVCLVSYNGQNGSYLHRLYRRDLRLKGEDPVKEAFDMLEIRSRREGIGVEDKNAVLSDLARRGIMAYAERAILLQKSEAAWRMGHGSPTPYELMTGFWAHHPEMVDMAISVMRGFVEHERFVFVPSAPGRHLIMLGNALRPLEYLIVKDIKDDLLARLELGGYRGEAKRKIREFIHDVGSKIVIGLYRVSNAAPPSLFYAHADHVQTAALIAMSDSILQFHRGFPMLIDLADHLCRSTFGSGDFISTVQQAYTETGNPTKYLGERETRIR